MGAYTEVPHDINDVKILKERVNFDCVDISLVFSNTGLKNSIAHVHFISQISEPGYIDAHSNRSFP